jgi:hypothetical protein
MTRVMNHMHILRQLLPAAALAVATASCGSAALTGQSPVYVTVGSLTGAPGGTSKGNSVGTFSTPLQSSVQVLLTTPAPCSAASPCPAVFDDIGQISLQLTPKNAVVAPTSNNQVTFTRYHVAYIRADGLNTPGVGVPYPFDGALTVTVPPTGIQQVTFELVRLVAKEEAPLVQLIENPLTVINTIATVTLYGSDQVGNAVSVAASMSIEFAYFPNQ